QCGERRADDFGDCESNDDGEHGGWADQFHGGGCGDGCGESDGERQFVRCDSGAQREHCVRGQWGQPDGDGDTGGGADGNGDYHGGGERRTIERQHLVRLDGQCERTACDGFGRGVFVQRGGRDERWGWIGQRERGDDQWGELDECGQVWQWAFVQRDQRAGDGERFGLVAFDDGDDAGGVGECDDGEQRVAGCDLQREGQLLFGGDVGQQQAAWRRGDL